MFFPHKLWKSYPPHVCWGKLLQDSYTIEKKEKYKTNRGGDINNRPWQPLSQRLALDSESDIPAYHRPFTRTPQIFLDGDFSAQSCPVARKNSLYKPQVHECYHAKKNENTGQPLALIGNIPFRRSQSGMFTQSANPLRELNLALLACGVIVLGCSSSNWQVKSSVLNVCLCSVFSAFMFATVSSRVECSVVKHLFLCGHVDFSWLFFFFSATGSRTGGCLPLYSNSGSWSSDRQEGPAHQTTRPLCWSFHQGGFVSICQYSAHFSEKRKEAVKPSLINV